MRTDCICQAEGIRHKNEGNVLSGHMQTGIRPISREKLRNLEIVKRNLTGTQFTGCVVVKRNAVCEDYSLSKGSPSQIEGAKSCRIG